MSHFLLACMIGACYTPADMPVPPSAQLPELLIHVQAEELCAANQQEALSQMAAILARKAGLPNARALLDSALQREESEPTYLGKGMALPHARVAGLPCAGVCVAHAAAGIPWQTERAQLLIFLAVPEETPELYLHLMSRLVRWRLRLADSDLARPLLPAAEWKQTLYTLLAL